MDILFRKFYNKENYQLNEYIRILGNKKGASSFQKDL